MEAADQGRVSWNAERSRYELHVDHALAGFADVTLGAGSATFTHTVVEPSFQGRGLAGVLARESLADVVDRGLSIVPVCPYIRAYLERHQVPGAVVEWVS